MSNGCTKDAAGLMDNFNKMVSKFLADELEVSNGVCRTFHVCCLTDLDQVFGQ